MTAEEVKAAGAMAVLLKDAIKPNIVQTLEGQLCFMHAGPFANIAHGNNSIIADRIGLKLGEFVITESGFAADLGMEKFMDIVCRVGGFRPHVVVIVATVRALRHHGGGDWREKADARAMAAEVEVGMANLAKHIENVRAFGIQPVVAINTRPDDEPELLELIKARSLEAGAFGAAIHDGFGQGGAGHDRARRGRRRRVRGRVGLPDALRRRRADRDEDREDRDDRLRRRRASSSPPRRARRSRATRSRASRTCRSAWRRRTSRSRTTRCCATGPTGFTVPIRDIRVYSGAGMLVPLCGDMLQMPGFGPSPPRSRSTSTRTARRSGSFRTFLGGEASASPRGTAHPRASAQSTTLCP